MKKGVGLGVCFVMIVLFTISGCGINDRGVDPGLENDAGRFTAHDHQRGDGFGLWNQQRDPKNPIAQIITRDERPGRGINGIVDRRPPEMNQRITRFDASVGKDNSKALTGQSTTDNNIPEQVRMELLQFDTVRDVRVISQQNRLLVAVETEASDDQAVKNSITEYLTSRYPSKDVIVVTDRQAVDRIRLLDDGFRDEQHGILDSVRGPIVGQ